MVKKLARGAALFVLLFGTAQAQDPQAVAMNKVRSIDHVVINVTDIETSLIFYKKLGFKLNNEDGWRQGKGQVSIQIGDSQKLNIHRAEEMGPATKFQDTGPNDRFGLAKAVVAGSADFCVVWEGTVEEAQQFLKNAGVKTFTRNVTGARGPSASVYFRDPDGNLWEFTVYNK